MALADVIFSRRDGLPGRLPDRLEDLRGPQEGVVVLPVHLTWHGLREFDVSSDESRLVLYSILLGQAGAGNWRGLLTRGGSPRTGRRWPPCSASACAGPANTGWACPGRASRPYAGTAACAWLDACVNT